MLEYLPDPTGPKKDILPPHSFFWTTLYTLYFDASEAYIAQVEVERRKKAHHLNKQILMDIDEERMDELLKHEYQSKKKGKRLGTLLLEKKKNRQ